MKQERKKMIREVENQVRRMIGVESLCAVIPVDNLGHKIFVNLVEYENGDRAWKLAYTTPRDNPKKRDMMVGTDLVMPMVTGEGEVAKSTEMLQQWLTGKNLEIYEYLVTDEMLKLFIKSKLAESRKPQLQDGF